MRKNGSRIKSSSILKKLLIPMMIVILIQSALFSAVILWGGTLEQISNNAFDVLNERVINRKNYLQNDMIQRWSSVEEAVLEINHGIQSALQKEGLDVATIHSDTQETADLLDMVFDKLVFLLRKNSVTGAFIVLNGKDAALPAVGEKQRKSGVWIRDLDPSGYPSDNSDLLLEVAPSAVTKAKGVSMDTHWMPQFTFDGDSQTGGYDFFYKPFQAAVDHPEIEYQDLGYWSKPFSLFDGGLEIITYSVPLVSDSGIPYGVMGIEISTDFLRKQMPYSEIDGEKRGAYLLGVGKKGSLSYDNIIASGPIYRQLVGEAEKTDFEPEEVYRNSYQLENIKMSDKQAFGCIQPLQLYNSNTPFSNDQWVLIGIVEKGALLGFVEKQRTAILVALLVSLFIGVISSLIMGKWVTDPIRWLVHQVKNSDPRRPVVLDQTKISEIDELSSSIEYLSRDVADFASKLSEIIEITGMPIGAFEYQKSSDRVFYTKRFFELLNLPVPEDNSGYEDTEVFGSKMETLKGHIEDQYIENGNNIMLFLLDDQRWVRMKLVEESEKILGVVIDVTQEMQEKRKIEYERDYDLLTNLLNRRAFHVAMTKLFEEPQELKISALIMMDLDNLKYMNDTYGHDYGDEYIRHTAEALRKFAPPCSLISRMSGDEFYVFLYGFQEKEKLRELVLKMKNEMSQTGLQLPDGTFIKIRASAGVAWYPDDTTSYEELIHYADFAMYKVKNSVKGEISEFDMESYNQDAYLLHGREELNKLIENRLVEYWFQPIVEVRRARIYAYEALMRSKRTTFNSPSEILTLARSQFKLYQIEHLTWFEALKTFDQFGESADGFKLFVNSIPNQVLSEDDIDELSQKYARLLNRVVLELTEEEKQQEDFTDRKLRQMQAWGGEIALDDLGSGYNGDSALLNLMPDYVKIDVSIVRGIDHDENRRALCNNLISFSKARGIQVIAEGVETFEEMETLIMDGVDYLQGYYLGRPQPALESLRPEITAQILQAVERKDVLEQPITE